MKISTILDQIDDGQIALPEFQRGYVWSREQVRELMTSLYKQYPIGSLMVWATSAEGADIRHGETTSGPVGVVKLLLDGQQRMTSLYGIVRGRPPRFFEGNAKAFTGLNFHLATETFEFYGPVKMKNDPLWVDVTKLLQPDGLKPWLRLLAGDEEHGEDYLERLNRLREILNIEIHHHTIEGPDKTVDIVVDIFNKVNSGGTMLSKGDLALAKICATWPDARQTMNEHLATWHSVGFDFKLDWLLRVTNAVLTGESLFSALKDLGAAEFAKGLDQSAAAVNQVINLVSTRLGLDHDRVFTGRYAVPVMARYLTAHAEQFPDAAEQDKLLYWYVQSMIWGRHSGSTESTLQQDLNALGQGGLDKLIGVLRDSRGDLTIRPGNFDVSSIGSRFYPLLYLLSRVWGAKDLGTGNDLSAHLLGKLARLEVHHLFPKAMLAANGHSVGHRNAVANFALLTQETNLAISAKLPSRYFPEMEEKHPGVLASQWIPQDPALWQVENYGDFLAERRSLLAAAANDFFSALLGGALETGLSETRAPSIDTALVVSSTAPVVSEAEQPLHDLKEWFAQRNLPSPELYYEITNDDGSEVLVEVDAAWPDGLQPGLGQPVAYLLEPDPEAEERLNSLNFRYFTSLDQLRSFALRLLGDLGDTDQLVVDGIAGDEGKSNGGTETVDVAEAAMDSIVLPAGMEGILALADEYGVRVAVDRAVEVAHRHGLGMRPYKRSLMLTPPGNKTKMLLNIALTGDDQTNDLLSEDIWPEFYDVDLDEVADAMGGLGRRLLGNDGLLELLGRLDDLLASIERLDDPMQATSATARIVAFLRSEPASSFTAYEVADRLGIHHRVAMRRLSILVTPRCPAAYAGAVQRLDEGRYQAIPST